METRKCIHCNKELPLDSFRKRDKVRKGRYTVCITCESIRKKEYLKKIQDKDNVLKSKYYLDLLSKYEHTEPDKVKEKIRKSLRKTIENKKLYCSVCGELLKKICVSVLKIKDKKEYHSTICCNFCAKETYWNLKKAQELKDSGFFD